MEASATRDAVPVEERRHPRGLYALFFTEMWERFCYYGMRALLVLYLIQYHGWQPGHASTVYKWYTSLAYLLPIAGGLLADRVIGLRASIVAGGALMAAGEVCLTFSAMPLFYLGLGLLIVGNGLFKPNISTIVGKLYRQGDARRDRAFTIFYMGINIGAGISPIACGFLREHYGFRYGFAVAALGMVVALVVFLTTQRQVLEDVEAAGNDLRVAARRTATDAAPPRDAGSDVPGAGGVAGAFARAFLVFMGVVAVALPADYIWRAASGGAAWTDVIMPVAFGGIAGWLALILRRIEGAARDKSIVIFVIFLFAVLFWMAFEQAGNALNLWAQFHTDLSIGGYHYPAEWWQTANAVLIVVFAPVFARAWTWLGERGLEPSTPMKMLAAMVFMTLSFVAMVAGARVENGAVTTQALASLPSQVPQAPGQEGRVVVGDDDAGRLTFDPTAHALEVRGVLPRYVVNDLLHRTVPAAFTADVASLETTTRQATPEAPVRVTFASVPAGFVFPFEPADAADRGIAWDAATSTMTSTRWMEAPTLADIAAAGAPPAWRDALQALEKKTDASRVSGIWLLLSYLFATLGELCLSPVGLSMVTKLAPARFASLFMGVWFLAAAVAQYAGGSIGESWGIIPPAAYFMVFVWTSIGGAVLLAVLVRPLKQLMHEVT
jgi:POT family proton-dependent oligopeptide transporter